MQYLLSPEEYEALRNDKEAFEDRIKKECDIRLGKWHMSVIGKISGMRSNFMTGRDVYDAFVKASEETKP